MSVKLYIVGNSNVDRYFPLVKAARIEPSIQDATVVRATNLAQIKEALVPAVPTINEISQYLFSERCRNHHYQSQVVFLLKDHRVLCLLKEKIKF
jgi:hypothetical protein